MEKLQCRGLPRVIASESIYVFLATDPPPGPPISDPLPPFPPELIPRDNSDPPDVAELDDAHPVVEGVSADPPQRSTLDPERRIVSDPGPRPLGWGVQPALPTSEWTSTDPPGRDTLDPERRTASAPVSPLQEWDVPDTQQGVSDGCLTTASPLRLSGQPSPPSLEGEVPDAEGDNVPVQYNSASRNRQIVGPENQLTALRLDQASVRSESHTMSEENTMLQWENDSLRQNNKDLRLENARLTRKIGLLRGKHSGLTQANANLLQENTDIAWGECRLSSTTKRFCRSWVPSSDQ